ncbi:tRNA uridine 5-carboxymethylaminomethyl modification enzyme [Thermodesulfovibrio aggregans]|uniref:tRNA uridine 5-carboxymethylaminomethyl modification enzyme MnmG n=1 Tax=Thermodesulfovibrio aggregans TaxID=86166 RepID=A0A0U9HPA2_9BACT|nr:tRNA uridine-5-carboxymethylaminomethyl(34) synthesis enzyme MnmG [Thermodesulfovibrio aggregans]GAQ94888.1 tRNA uridine 5-carboxymethylaminomethyl modification enzyme [Thermodesulfovibrio aggregans]
MYREKDFDIIVIGAGHAGCEAAHACAKMGFATALFTIYLDTIAQLSCNPAIGGLAKGHLVREIDALGGIMAKVTDMAGIQFRMLNRSKGPAVWSLRAQADRILYNVYMRKLLEATENLFIKQAMVEEIVVENGKVKGVITSLGVFYGARAVIVTPGTFLNGLIHIGLDSFEAGRAGEFPSKRLSDSLKKLGLKLGRLKTGTPPRIDAKTIDFSKTEEQWGDFPPPPFSYSTKEITNPQVPCYITYTNEKTHEIILKNLDRSPLYSGKIVGIGPRYCPSIEDKVVKFREKPRHQIFLEPEGLSRKEYYANGIPTSLPYDVQVAFVRTIPGLEDAEIMRPGYAIEYDFVYPTQITHTLEVKGIEGLYLAGQINGTSGYEEAAAQGLMAGVNAALKIKGKPPLILGRDEAYIGVLIDDLVTKGTQEPYRMFTSRAEFRLLLRHDNADLRLREYGFRIGLVDEETYEKFLKKKEALEREIKRLKTTIIKPSDELNRALTYAGTTPIEEATHLDKILKRPEINYEFIKRFAPSEESLTKEIEELVEIHIKYEGYIAKQMEQVERMKQFEEKIIPEDFDFNLPGLSKEVIQKLNEVRPRTIGQAMRIPGVTPAAISILMVAIQKGAFSRK